MVSRVFHIVALITAAKSPRRAAAVDICILFDSCVMSYSCLCVTCPWTSFPISVGCSQSLSFVAIKPLPCLTGSTTGLSAVTCASLSKPSPTLHGGSSAFSRSPSLSFPLLRSISHHMLSLLPSFCLPRVAIYIPAGCDLLTCFPSSVRSHIGICKIYDTLITFILLPFPDFSHQFSACFRQ